MAVSDKGNVTPVPDEGIPPREALIELASKGMLYSFWAERFAGRTALLSARGNRSYAELNGNANRLLAHLRAQGLDHGDAVAIICQNIPQFIETYLACQRGGLRLTPINWHLTPAEAGFILEDCDAKAWIVQDELTDRAADADRSGVCTALTTGPAKPGFQSYQRAIEEQDPANPAEPRLGKMMLYTSGTTGKPKGVVRHTPIILGPQREGSLQDYRDDDLNLLCGPAYHAGPLTFDIAFPLASGVPILMMERFDPVHALSLIAKFRVTHTHMVSTMFKRLLALPAAERDQYDVSSLRVVNHGAAPTSIPIKRAMIDWFGDVLYEYYGATEASPGIIISSAEWLEKPGSVGRVPETTPLVILDKGGRICLPNQTGLVAFPRHPGATPSYHKAASETNDGIFGGKYYTVGDIGHIDEDGYLFLTGRSAETIISGGVNIYPQEVDNALIDHPAIREVCTVGVPDEEWGESVKTLVSLNPGFVAGTELANELMSWARDRIARYKVPRSIDFVEEIPFSEAGKVLRERVRARFWSQDDRTI